MDNKTALGENPQAQQCSVDDVNSQPECRARAQGEGAAGPPAVASESQLVVDGADAENGVDVMRELESRPGMAKKVVDAIERGLDATWRRYDRIAKEWVYEPDPRTRLAAASKALEYLVGLPVARGELKPVNSKPKPAANYEEMLRRSPAMREAARRALERAEAAAAQGEV